MHPENERERLRALHHLNILDSDPESCFDDLTKLAATICETPISLISFIDSDRQWFKSHHGLATQETPRDEAICGHTILEDQALIIEDVAKDPRFRDNLLFRKEPRIRFYAGIPLKTDEGFNVGSLCVADHRPRRLTETQLTSLHLLAKQVMRLLELKGKIRGIELSESEALSAQVASRRLSKALSEERNKIWGYLELAPVGVSVVQGPNFIYEIVNQEYRRLAATNQEFVGRAHFDLFPHLKGTKIETIMKRVYESGQSISATDYRVESPAGDNCPASYLDFQLQPFSNPDGSRGILTIAIDTTKKNQALNALKESVEKFKLFAETAPHMAFIADAGGNILYFNQRWHEYIGDSSDSSGWNWLKESIHHPDDLQRTIEAWGRSVVSGKPFEMEYRLRRHDGTYRWHLGRALAIRNDQGQITRWFGNNVDIHDQKELARQLLAAKNTADEANLAKSNFLANMSHEIRTPLGAIMGFAEELEQPGISPEQVQRYVSVINRNSAHLQRIIDDILDLSKVEAGKMLIERIDCSLTDLISEFIAFMNPKAVENGIKFNCTIQEGIPQNIASDPVRIRQILSNIVGNAIKFTPNGRIDLHVSATKEFIEFKVVDTGVGISQEQAKKLFQPFIQADLSTTRRFGGTGLGLALTKKLCESMGGEFFLESSAPDQGSTFVARIKWTEPRSSFSKTGGKTSSQEKSESHLESPPKSSSPAHRPLQDSKILLVEDSRDNQLLIQILLEKAGARVTVADDGRQGIRKALQEDFSLVLMDVQMPEMDGIDAAQELRKKGYDKPIVALTAHAMKEEKERCLKSGFDDFLTKPVQKDRMIAILKTNINQWGNHKRPLGIEIQ